MEKECHIGMFRTSKKDYNDMAELEAKNDVLRQLGLERLKSNQVETATDTV